MKTNRIIQFLLVSILVVSAFNTAPPQVASPTHTHPHLLELAAENPGQLARVIVQKTPGAEGVEALAENLGGKAIQDLSIINAFAAEMNAQSAVELSRAQEVRWVSPDTAMVQPSYCSECIPTSNLANTYIRTINADKVWNRSPFIQGQGVGIAIVDSGINPSGDFYTVMGVNRQVANVRFNTDYNQNTSDGYGHGTHVASIAGGDGSDSNGLYIGVAPMANIVNVKVSNDDGSAMMVNVIQGLQWVLENKDRYNIQVVNLSLNSTVEESYHTSPLDAAIEILWFNQIVVVASAGNHGNGTIYPPANDPFVITVGATDDKGTYTLSDDSVASFSAYSTTIDGFTKPDLVAPGKDIIARLVNSNMGMAGEHPENLVGNQYFRMSGTSASAPMVSGAVALLLQDEPNLTPDQVKYRLMATANNVWPGYSPTTAGAGYLDVQSALQTNTIENANTGTLPSQLLYTGPDPIAWNSASWNSVGWNTVGWNTVGWNTVGWNTVGWNTVGWNSDYWDD